MLDGLITHRCYANLSIELPALRQILFFFSYFLIALYTFAVFDFSLYCIVSDPEEISHSKGIRRSYLISTH